MDHQTIIYRVVESDKTNYNLVITDNKFLLDDGGSMVDVTKELLESIKDIIINGKMFYK